MKKKWILSQSKKAKRSTFRYLMIYISREDTFKREVSSLLGIKDAYPKVLIARTKHDESQHEGIRIIDIARWLSDSRK